MAGRVALPLVRRWSIRDEWEMNNEISRHAREDAGRILAHATAQGINNTLTADREKDEIIALQHDQ